MKFSDMEYKRPDVEKTIGEFSDLIESLKRAESFEEEKEIIHKVTELRKDFDSMKMLAEINYTNDTSNEDCQKEQDYFDDNYPLFEEYLTKYDKALVKCKFREELSRHFGDYLFRLAEMNARTVNHEVIDDLQKENHLGSRYTKLKASARIEFRGQILNLQELEPYMESEDRETRSEAFHTYWNFFSENAAEFDEIYDKLVFLRNDMAVKLGYRNFTELGYDRMQRADYNPSMVDAFRKSIRDHIVPLSLKLREKQRNRLGLDKLMVYDLFYHFKSGNSHPKGDPDWILKHGETMYDELSPETSEFYRYMMSNDLMDVKSRMGKADMGYCEYIPKYRNPYIFANMNGTDDDITVLTHEAGHAFQSYCNRDFELFEYMLPTYETAEIHSMSMEFLTYPWMKLFFEEDTEKFKFAHLCNTVHFLPYGVLVDEFQHWVYDNPKASPADRKSKWRDLEKIYMPHLDYGDFDFLESGGRWQKQGHIYESPFYYIDYCLAQICAFQFWSSAIHNSAGFDDSLKRYIHLCNLGGSRSFLELLKLAGLESPFDEKVVSRLAGEIESYLDSIDDSGF